MVKLIVLKRLLPWNGEPEVYPKHSKEYGYDFRTQKEKEEYYESILIEESETWFSKTVEEDFDFGMKKPKDENKYDIKGGEI